MPELHDALSGLDRPQDPRPAFAADLEARFLAVAAGAEAPAASAVLPEADGAPVEVEVGDQPTVPAPLGHRRVPPRRRAQLVLAAAAVVLAALVAAVLVTARDDAGPARPTPPPAPTTTAVAVTTSVLPSGDTLTHRLSFAASPAAGTAPKRITYAGDGLWVPLAGTGRATLLDSETLEVLREVDTGLDDVADVAEGGGAVWFTGKGGVSRLTTDESQATLREGLAGNGDWTMAIAGDVLWAALLGDQEIHRLDLTTDELTSFAAPGPVSQLAASGSRLWVFTEPDGTTPARLHGLDPATGATVVTVDVPAAVEEGDVGNLFAAGDGVWLAGGGLKAWVQHVADDGTAGAVVTLPGNYADGMAAAGDGVWVAVRFGTDAYRVRTADGSIVDQVTVPDRTADLEVEGDVLWTASYRDSAVERILLAG